MTTVPAADGALQPARQALADAISKLIDPQRQTLPSGRHTYLDSTYQQLADAVYEKHALGGGRSCPASPLWIDASDCLIAIDTLAKAEHPEITVNLAQNRAQAPKRATMERLQAVDAKTWRPQDTQHILELANNLARLTAKAEHLLTPPTMWFLPDPCPLCNQTHAYVDDNGDRVRRPALQLTPDYCRCQNQDCDGYWQSSRFQFLGKLLGYRTPEGIIR